MTTSRQALLVLVLALCLQAQAEAGPALASELKRKGTRVVLFLGNDAELTTLTGKAQALGWAPYLLLSPAGSTCTVEDLGASF